MVQRAQVAHSQKLLVCWELHACTFKYVSQFVGVSPAIQSFCCLCLHLRSGLELPLVPVTPGPHGTSPRDVPASAHVPHQC